MTNQKTDREFIEEASALAVDIAERGMKSVVDYMKTGLRVTPPTDAKRSDIERAMHVAADGLDGARKAAVAKRSSEQTELERRPSPSFVLLRRGSSGRRPES